MPPSELDPTRVLGCLVGGAVGEALGRPIEPLTLAEIHHRHGPAGVTGYTGPASGRTGEATQLSLLTARSGFQASVRARARGIGGAFLGITQENYLTWLASLGPGPHPGAGRTTLTALRKATERGKPAQPLGRPTAPINNSKGCAGTTRAAPCGFGHPDPEETFLRGQGVAALTHGHPSGHLPAGTLAVMIAALVRGADLPTALTQALDELERHDDHQETTQSLNRAMTLATAPATPTNLESLGRGFTAPEALAIAVYAALTAEAAGGHPLEIVPRGLLRSVNHSGDSDSTGALCGNLLGARYGAQAIPEHWRTTIEALPDMTDLAQDLVIELGPNPPADAYGEPPHDWHFRHST